MGAAGIKLARRTHAHVLAVQREGVRALALSTCLVDNKRSLTDSAQGIFLADRAELDCALIAPPFVQGRPTRAGAGGVVCIGFEGVIAGGADVVLHTICAVFNVAEVTNTVI